MPLPANMHALILKGEGLLKTRSGTSFDTLEPWLDYREVPVPKPRAGQVLV